MAMRILMIQRAPRFSPNSEEKDLAILEAVAGILRHEGHTVCIVSESVLCPELFECDFVFSMGRLPETLKMLKSLTGIPVINTPVGIENCIRSQLTTIMKRIGTPLPPEEGLCGYWLKRGDAVAQSKDDVQFVADKAELEEKKQQFISRGIKAYTVSAHVKGDLVKFYSVSGTAFFRYYYPTDDGDSKFGDEHHNGKAQHFPFDVSSLRFYSEQLAKAVGIRVYGGDCIVRQDGSFCIIDFNDWPSFSRCREEAAGAIASLIKN